MLIATAVIDADGHVIEQDTELANYLPSPYKGHPEILGTPFFPSLDGFNRPARRVADGQGRTVPIPSMQDWLSYLEEANIAWTVLYPTSALAFGLVRDPDWAVALAQAYNDWLYDRYLRHSSRLRGMALIPLQNIPVAVRELRRAVSELGMVGAILPAVGLRQPFGHQDYWPLYDVAQELGCLLTVHAGATQGLGLDHLDRLIEVRTLSHGFGQMIQMTSMMFGGVFDAFPRLKVAYAEAGCGWVPYLSERLDLEYEHRTSQAPALKRRPSEHLRSGRIYVHCELEEAGIPRAVEVIGDGALFVASDYPHEPKSEFPEAVERFMGRADLSESTKLKILTENPKAMYGAA